VTSTPDGVARVRATPSAPPRVVAPVADVVPEHRSPAPGNRIKRTIIHLYAALHRWGESGWSGSAVGGWGVLQGSVVPGPSDALLIPLGLADPRRALVLAAWATAGATIGGLIAYAIGAQLLGGIDNSVVGWLGISPESWESRRAQFESQGWILVALSTISPLSTKVVCLGAGAFGLPAGEFFLALLAGRAVRFLAVGLMLRFAGKGVRKAFERWLGRPVETLR
jgi:membrane protein YqaA with SNARE-associated domain